MIVSGEGGDDDDDNYYGRGFISMVEKWMKTIEP